MTWTLHLFHQSYSFIGNARCHQPWERCVCVCVCVHVNVSVSLGHCMSCTIWPSIAISFLTILPSATNWPVNWLTLPCAIWTNWSPCPIYPSIHPMPRQAMDLPLYMSMQSSVNPLHLTSTNIHLPRPWPVCTVWTTQAMNLCPACDLQTSYHGQFVSNLVYWVTFISLNSPNQSLAMVHSAPCFCAQGWLMDSNESH